MNLTYEQADKLIDLLVEHFDQTCDTYEQAMVYAADGLRYNLGKFSPDELLRYAQGSGCPAAVAMLEESGDEEAVNGSPALSLGRLEVGLQICEVRHGTPHGQVPCREVL